MTENLFTAPDLDPDTLAHLGPLSAMAGIWEGTTGTDVHLTADGAETSAYVERYELQPLDPQTSGPQYFYGLRYHVHINKPGEIGTFHDQVGYWLWDPEANSVVQTIAIPRAQVIQAIGTARADDTAFSLHAELGSPIAGIASSAFLDRAFKTVAFDITVTINPDGTWGYEQDTVLEVLGRDEPFHHTDRHVLRKVADPTPNPLAR